MPMNDQAEPQPVTSLEFSQHQFLMLAQAQGDSDAIHVLKQGELSKRMVLLGTIAAQVINSNHPASRSALRAFEVLGQVQQMNSVVFSQTILNPYFGPWLSEQTQTTAANTLFLGNVVAAAAIRAGVECELEVQVAYNKVHLPTLGCLDLSTSDDQSTVFRLDADGAFVISGTSQINVPSDPTEDSANWTSLRRLVATTSGLTLEVALDELSPYRDAYGVAVAQRMDASQFSHWIATFSEAWELLVTHHREQAEAMAAGLTSLVPMLDGPNPQSLTMSAALGAISTTTPPDAIELALTLIHEFQHNKFGWLTNLVTLHVLDESRYYAPWRGDPRPLGGLLNGTYAHLGIVGFWHRQMLTGETSGRQRAEMEFVRWREQVRRAIEVMEASDAPTDLGRDFLSGMRSALEPSLTQDVDAQQRRFAYDMALDHESTWRLRNCNPNKATIEELAEAWIHELPCPLAVGTPVDFTLEDHGNVNEPTTRQREIHRILAGMSESLEAVDRAFLDGDYATAMNSYREQILLGDTTFNTWAGLVSAARRTQKSTPSTLTNYPEIIYALYGALGQSDGWPDPIALSDWVDAALFGFDQD